MKTFTEQKALAQRLGLPSIGKDFGARDRQAMLRGFTLTQYERDRKRGATKR